MRGSGLATPTTQESTTVSRWVRRPVSFSMASTVPSLFETTAARIPAARRSTSASRTPAPTRRHTLLRRWPAQIAAATPSSPSAGTPESLTAFPAASADNVAPARSSMRRKNPGPPPALLAVDVGVDAQTYCASSRRSAGSAASSAEASTVAPAARASVAMRAPSQKVRVNPASRSTTRGRRRGDRCSGMAAPL